MAQQRTPEQKRTAMQVMAETATSMARATAFAGRGLSQRTIDALTAHGIELPEVVLIMSDAELRALPGIGKAAMQEIAAYRALVRRNGKA